MAEYCFRLIVLHDYPKKEIQETEAVLDRLKINEDLERDEKLLP